MFRSLLSLTLITSFIQANEALVIHEWGTFTSLQDDAGRSLGNLNTDEEALPRFVHDLHPVELFPHGDAAPVLSKGFRRNTPEVTMRLETPVIYVHLPPTNKSPVPLSLSVNFKSGILSQFYPRAEAIINGSVVPSDPKWVAPRLTSSTTSSLQWSHIIAGDKVSGPETDSHVWLAPRKTTAAGLTVGNEQEHYLFYRGVAHLDAPLVVKRSADATNFTIATRDNNSTLTTVPTVWLVDITTDGRAAFRRQTSNGATRLEQLPATFAPSDYSMQQLDTLKRELHTALVADGLFADEASAMLATWDASYFRAAGLRLFFLVPQAWTDQQLSIQVSPPSDIHRIMMGRIELISQDQRQALATIARGPTSTSEWWYKIYSERIFSTSASTNSFLPGSQRLVEELQNPYNRGFLERNHLAVPPNYQAYLSLGRFRDALVLDAWHRAPTPELIQFVQTYVDFSLKENCRDTTEIATP